jgi:adenosylcobinamide-phosphate synthase
MGLRNAFSVDAGLIFCIIIAWVTDAVLGDMLFSPIPAKLVHMVVRSAQKRFITLISSISRKKPDEAAANKTIVGYLYAIYTNLLIFMILAVIIDLSHRAHTVIYHMLTAYLLYSALSLRDVTDKAWAVSGALKRGDINEARRSARALDSADTPDVYATRLTDSSGVEPIIRATVSSVSRASIDLVISPMLYILLGALLGIPAPLLFLFKTTAALAAAPPEEMLHPVNSFFNILNFIPTRLSSILLPLSAMLCGKGFANSSKVVRRDHQNDLGYRGVWGEAAFAGALRIRLGGDALFGDATRKKPNVGDDYKAPEPSDIDTSVRILIAASVIMFMLTLGVLFIF